MKTERQPSINIAVGTILHSHSKTCLAAAFLAAIMLLPHTAESATTWDNSVTSGSWNSASNWIGGAPSNSNAPTILNSSTNAITITNATGTYSSVGFAFQNTGAGSTTLKLGTNLTASRNAADTFFFNTGASSALTVDLNSFTLSFGNGASSGILSSRNYTIKDTSVAGNGVFSLANITRTTSSTTGTVVVENNATVLITTRANMDFRLVNSATSVGWNFAPTATLKLAGNGVLVSGTASPANFNAGASSFGKIIVGDATNTTIPLNYALNSNTTVKSDVTLVNGSFFSFNAVSNLKLNVGGNFTDLTVSGEDYGNNATAGAGGIFFNGGGSTVQEVNIARTGLTTQFSVGDGTTNGNVQLKHDLATASRVTINAGSTLDVGEFTVNAGTMLVSTGSSSNANLAYTFGSDDSGLLATTGALTLNSFNLKLTYNGNGWVDGSNLRLFTYGSLTGTPTLASFEGPSGWTYTSLWNDTDNSTVWLTGLSSVPEPSVFVLLAGGIVLLLVLRSRHARQST